MLRLGLGLGLGLANPNGLGLANPNPNPNLDAEECGVVVVRVAARRGGDPPAVGQLGAQRGRREPAEL